MKASMKKLTELPVAMHETGKETLYPLFMVADLLEKMENNDWCIAHCDQSIGTVANIKNMLEVLSDGRIKFIK